MLSNLARRAFKAFTLVELLVVVGVIALLIAILMPALTAARHQANSVQCAANIRQICQALFVYAADNRGSFPPNVIDPLPGLMWYDYDRAGRLLHGTFDSKQMHGVHGPVMTCPEDAGATRSYAMNIWASSNVDLSVRQSGWGTGWKQGVQHANAMILVTEAWSAYGSATDGWDTWSTVGWAAPTPGRQFGAGGGVSPLLYMWRFGYVNCELPYYRHRAPGTQAGPTDPRGRISIGYADGHVELKSDRKLADPFTGLSTLDSWWSPIDDKLNK
jgi:prepilin-type processing-associated H-X9-DG protein